MLYIRFDKYYKFFRLITTSNSSVMSRLSIFLCALVFVSASHGLTMREKSIAEIDGFISLVRATNFSNILFRRTQYKMGTELVKLANTVEAERLFNCTKRELVNILESEKGMSCCENTLPRMLRTMKEAKSCSRQLAGEKTRQEVKQCYTDTTAEAQREFRSFCDELGIFITDRTELLVSRVLSECRKQDKCVEINETVQDNSSTTEENTQTPEPETFLVRFKNSVTSYYDYVKTFFGFNDNAKINEYPYIYYK